MIAGFIEQCGHIILGGTFTVKSAWSYEKHIRCRRCDDSGNGIFPADTIRKFWDQQRDPE